MLASRQNLVICPWKWELPGSYEQCQSDLVSAPKSIFNASQRRIYVIPPLLCPSSIYLPSELAELVSRAQNACAATSNCLNVAEATNIAWRYVTSFETDKRGQGTGVTLIPSTFAPQLQVLQRGCFVQWACCGLPKQSELTSALESSGYTGAVVNNVKYTLLDIFASCNMILLR
jgi:hypothetical protein